MFEHHLNIATVKGIHAHEPAGEIASTFQPGGDGPQPETDDLHLDFDGPYNSPWNTTIVEYLAGCCLMVQSSQDWYPKHDQEYFEALLFERLQDFKTEWDAASPRGNETREQAVARRLWEIENEGAQNRRATRRVRVRCVNAEIA
jgi:hypothetical protein